MHRENSWKAENLQKIKLNRPILIVGLPGIGNVGKISVDFLIEQLSAKKLCNFFSYKLPNSVFVNEKDVIKMPSISLYYKKFDKKNRNDILILAGEIQPMEEESTFEFCDKVLEIFRQYGGIEIITLAGIGYGMIPEQPKVYCTGNSESVIKKYREGTSIQKKIYGVVGPIVGVSGLLVGLAGRKKIPAVSILSETYNHPFYLGIKGSRAILDALNKKLDLNINMKKLDAEISKIESEMKKAERMATISQKMRAQRGSSEGTEYIG